jgi:hypothetical protein
MKTINKNKSNFPKPYKFTIYLIAVTIAGFMNWVALGANDAGMAPTESLETRLADALAPVPDPEPELDDWILSFADDNASKSADSENNLESRLAEALEPVEDPQPELEDWLLNYGEDFESGAAE